MTYKEALGKAASYCAYQERTQHEVRVKAREWELEPDQIEELIVDMIGQKFIDEERFARSYVRGKNQRRWGRRLIVQGLREKRLSEPCIRLALTEIDPDQYWENLQTLAAKKNRTLTDPHPLKRRYKILTFLAAKGYESDLSRDAVNEVLAANDLTDSTEVTDEADDA